MQLTNDIRYIGVNDHEIDMFEGQYDVPNGMAYNSYVILDEKIAVLDTVDARFGKEWLDNLKKALNGKSPDYLIVQHMEPDHSSNITTFKNEYPNAKVVASDKAFAMMKQFFDVDYIDNRLVVKEGDTLSLGKHNLTFFSAPMVHWPEVIVTYDSYDKVLFSADAFGKFGALDIEDEEGWACEARRYYFGIVGKYGMQASNLLKKISNLEINTICPLHGPVLSENLSYYIDLYKIWTSYGVESEGIVIAYTSVYGNTKKAVMLLKEELEKAGCPKVAVTDLARDDMHEAVEDAFRYGTLVLATTTYNNDIFPFMREFLYELLERGYKNRKIAIIENGTWAPNARKRILAILEEAKGLEILENGVTIRSAMTEENKKEIELLAKELCK
ncbi:MAG: FprA family A-type flavoprotein [Clostridia bacterium]|nr:FprA family A-type flavoprotein [Clostridia bacterium]